MIITLQLWIATAKSHCNYIIHYCFNDSLSMCCIKTKWSFMCTTSFLMLEQEYLGYVFKLDDTESFIACFIWQKYSESKNNKLKKIVVWVSSQKLHMQGNSVHYTIKYFIWILHQLYDEILFSTIQRIHRFNWVNINVHSFILTT